MKTLIAHKECGGSVVMEAKGAKFFAPSFRIGEKGLTNLVFDVDLGAVNGSIIPSWRCLKCNKEFAENEYDTELISTCMVCSKDKPVSDLVTHKTLSCVCRGCMTDLISASKGERNAKSRTLEFALAFGVTARPKLIPFSEILKQPIEC